MTKILKSHFGKSAYLNANESRKNTLKSVKNLDKKVGKGKKNNTKFYRRDN